MKYICDVCCDKAKINVYNGKIVVACPEHAVKVIEESKPSA